MPNVETIMKFFVTGGSGFLGHHLVQKLVEQRLPVVGSFFQHAIPVDSLKQVRVDVTDPKAVSAAIHAAEPDVIVHCAALAQPDFCEKHPERARAVNLEGTRHVLAAAKAAQLRFVYLSSDLVFDGEKGYYTEDDPLPPPQNVYVETKQRAERLTLAYENGLVIRPALMYGFDGVRPGRNFFEIMFQRFQRGEAVKLFVDQYRTPSQVRNLADVIIELAQTRETGILHAGGAERISRYEMGIRTCKIFGFDTALAVPTRMADIQLAASRPRDCSLDTTRVQQILRQTHLMTVTRGLQDLKSIFPYSVAS
ncbi:MAG: SDR family oxidoreductase [Gemmatimonadetes bacterium]|nr:MAG: SDR family oxidoreductase [Gemmatimonadota bacterium]